MKKTNHLTMVLIITCFTAVLVSCNKKGDDPGPTPPPPVITKTTLLTKAPWKIKDSGIDIDKNGTIDGFPLVVKACALDNTYTFNTNGSGVVDEDASKCVSTDPQTSPFNWIFKSGETILNGDFKLAGWSGDATIAALTDTSCILYKDTTTALGSARAIVSLKH